MHAWPQSGPTRLFSAAAHRQPTPPQRTAQHEMALERQRATAAKAQRGDSNSAPAFPAKDPAKQRPLLAGQRMVDIRVRLQVMINHCPRPRHRFDACPGSTRSLGAQYSPDAA